MFAFRPIRNRSGTALILRFILCYEERKDRNMRQTISFPELHPIHGDQDPTALATIPLSHHPDPVPIPLPQELLRNAYHARSHALVWKSSCSNSRVYDARPLKRSDNALARLRRSLSFCLDQPSIQQHRGNYLTHGGPRTLLGFTRHQMTATLALPSFEIACNPPPHGWL